MHPPLETNAAAVEHLTMEAPPQVVDLIWTLREDADGNTVTIIVGIVAALVLIFIVFFVGRVIMFRRRTQANRRVERANGADNDYLMYAYLQTQSPAVVRMRRLANADGLSLQELNDAAPVKSFSKESDSSDDNVCAVCLEEMEVEAKTRKMPCGHEFDARCIEEWVSKANRCPVCNTHIVEEEALQKRRVAVLEGRDPSPSTNGPRQRRRRTRGDHGVYELQDARMFNERGPSQQEQQEQQDDAANPRAAAGASDLRRDGSAERTGQESLLQPREATGEVDEEVRQESPARPMRAVPSADV